MSSTNTKWQLIEKVALPEVKAEGLWFRHKATGLEVFHVLNDDSENLFAFSFPSLPNDSSGTPHILEHLTLCGSEKYPLKDPFLVLLQGSLQTFLNAETALDHTSYPASTANETDYFNLMSVYGDAVFRPLLKEQFFRQEGWRYEVQKGKLALTGVVHNEMKAEYYSFESIANDSIRALFPKSQYSYNSGGDPEEIPTLTIEKLRAFHQDHYSPANCKVFLAGNIPTEKQLDFIDKIIASDTTEEPPKTDGTEKKISSPSGGGRVGVNCCNTASFSPPLAGGAGGGVPNKLLLTAPGGPENKKPTFLLSWAYGPANDIDDSMSLAFLGEILMGHDGSPLNKALVESGLGEDIAPASGIDMSFPQSCFTVGLRGIKSKGEEIEALIFKTLTELARQIPQSEIDAALNSAELSTKEIKRISGSPFSLVWLELSLRGWLSGKKPWETMLLDSSIERIKAKLAADSRFFEKLIEERLLNNTHRISVTVTPKNNFMKKIEAKQQAFLKEKTKELGKAGFAEIEKKNEELKKMQETPDSPELLALIPHVSLKDLSNKIEEVPRKLIESSTIPVLQHDLFTNGLCYIDLAFPIDTLDAEDYLWLMFFAEAITAVGFNASANRSALDYAEVSSLFAQNTGGLNAGMYSSGRSRDWIVFYFKALNEKLDLAIPLLFETLANASFKDSRRIADLVTEFKNDSESAIVHGSYELARIRSALTLGRRASVVELLRGVTQIKFTRRLKEMNISEVSAKLESLRNKIIASGCLANITASGETLTKVHKAITDRAGQLGLKAPQPENKALYAEGAFNHLIYQRNDSSVEVWTDRNLHIGTASASLKSSAFPERAFVAESVFASLISTGKLWENIRMKGGAYGCSATAAGLESRFTLSTYRDPSPAKSLAAFHEALGHAITQDDCEKAIISVYGDDTTPKSPAEKAGGDFTRYLSNTSMEQRQAKRNALISMTLEDLQSAAKRITNGLEIEARKVLFTSSSDAKAASKELKTDVLSL
ncbi:MAG: insulinase family protein [Spirochaetaceae bacterium]|jgi:Zn-dependent M16 (insulinase) family peptidase|nr:insulinase family protein [Spirochaetaceae bacterium]